MPSSAEAFGGSQWDHIVPYKLGGEHEKKGPWAGKPEEVFDRNIALVCRTCNRLKHDGLPSHVEIEGLLASKRQQRIEKIRSWVQELRRDARVVEEFAAFRELVELLR